MKFLRLRIANYRGIGTSEVKFSPIGITLVQGPNEVGKSSLREAVELLFEYPDSSRHRTVEAIRPIHRDEAPEIELEAESGPYVFTYFKRFYKNTQTKLTITRPRPENHTGREAHDRAQAVLRETVDVDLWKALVIQQGDAIQQPVLTKQTSVSAALDKAAGGRPTDPAEEGLFDKVRAEYGRYFTERGVEKKELQDARKLQDDTQVEVTEIEQQLHAIEQDIERAATLQLELSRLKQKEEELAKAVATHAVSLEEINTLENALATARLKLESAQKSEQVARRDKEARQGLIDTVTNAGKAHRGLEESTKISLSALKQAEDKLKEAQTIVNEADQRRKAADALAALRRSDFDYYTSKLHLDQFHERKDRIDQARKNAAQAEAVLAQNKMDSRMLREIQDAERELLTANAQLRTGAPNVLLRGLDQCKLQIDDGDIVLGKDETRTLSIADTTRLTIPGMLDIQITAGSSTEGLARKVDEAQRTLEAACTAAGVADPDEATKAFEARREALRSVETKGQVEKDNLRDLTYEQLEQKLLGLQKSVPDYLSKRVREPAICANLETAKRERANTEAARQAANDEWERARESLEGARNVQDSLSAKHQEAQVELDLLARNLKQAGENLDQARTIDSDDVLEARLTESVRAVSVQEASVRTAETSLSARNPERVKVLAETARGSLQTTQNRRNTTQTEHMEVQTRLRIRGEDGLYEKLNEAKARLERVARDNRALFGRAAAARQLFETMREERDKVRQAYVAPLKERVERLGHLIFDGSFQVEINEDLLIASRTTNGITIPFESLSGGTKEQLSLIFRLACSIIVAKDGGMPLILDDALGYTDPERLRLMGAVLAKAAKECQIVIFTCVPDRYVNIGDATVVPLG